jgi:hypothetical protein
MKLKTCNYRLLQKVKVLTHFIKGIPLNVIRDFGPLFDGDTIISTMKSIRTF